jgi:16S rRNA (uracil1498-N3)-methyltransferase
MFYRCTASGLGRFRKSLRFYQTRPTRLQSSSTAKQGLLRSPMPRFYCNQPLDIGMLIELPEAIAHHLQVLRERSGSVICLFNGQGGEYSAVLTDIDRKRARAEVKTFSAREAEPNHGLMLAQGLPEGSKMDWIIEKAVELGATAIQPLSCTRSVMRLSEERAAKKIVHWQGVIIAAAEQCGRNRLTTLSAPIGFNPWVAQRDMHQRILLSPRATQSLPEWARHHAAQAVTLMVGPEGGFSAEEEDAAIKHGALCLSLGTRVLRTETAGLAAIAALQALWGDL